MQVEVEELDGLERHLKVKLPEDRFEKAYQERLQEIAKSARISGFRPGKAPLQVIELRIGKTLRNEVASELMQSGFQQVVVDRKLKIAGTPEVKPGEIVKGKPLEFEVFYEAYPDVNLADFSVVEIANPDVNVTENDLDQALDKLRRMHANWHEVDRVAKMGDRVIIDFDGFIDKKPFPGGAGKNVPLILGSEEMIAGFEEALVGIKANEDRDVTLTFPEDYPLTNLANQTVLFKVKVHKVEEAEMPELDGDFAKKIGLTENTSVEQIRQQARDELQKELDRNIRVIVKKQVLDKLMELNPVSAPKSMIKDEIKHLQNITRQQIMMQQKRKVDPAKIDLPEEPYQQPAKKRVILGVLIAELIKTHDLKVEKEKVRERVAEMVAGYPNAEEVANYYMSNKRLLSEIEASVLEEQVVDKLLETAKKNSNPMTLQNLFAEGRKLGREA